MMTPEDQTPKKTVTSGGAPDSTRPTPWVPPTENQNPADGAGESAQLTEANDGTGEPSASPADVAGSEMPEAPKFGEPTIPTGLDAPAPEIPAASQGVPTGLNSPASSVSPTGPLPEGPTPQPPFESPTAEPTPVGVPINPASPQQPLPDDLATAKRKTMRMLILAIVLVVVVAAIAFFGLRR